MNSRELPDRSSINPDNAEKAGVDTMDLLRHWLAEIGEHPQVVILEHDLADYREQGWTISGPFVLDPPPNRGAVDPSETFVLWVNRATRAYQATTFSPGEGWERIEVGEVRPSINPGAVCQTSSPSDGAPTNSAKQRAADEEEADRG